MQQHAVNIYSGSISQNNKTNEPLSKKELNSLRATQLRKKPNISSAIYSSCFLVKPA